MYGTELTIQATENCKSYEPIVVMKKNRKKPLVVIDAEAFLRLHKEYEQDTTSDT